ncbi:site-specific DNA-methyltransferase [Aequorivita vladivostokensis]|uniref:site-specific DNA-methyltransferase (adenine-specific) n=1 Tax=Aequorivita vladivostokensis TaxID=171194 RepID=A0ABR5DIZ2_9FLAO|nr:site-specific DNA-methyltransferase [Aequorivita vladivostokensis]KJJ38739.1 type III restriction endonuclease subunit M [Aequorivita vladivostokensis]
MPTLNWIGKEKVINHHQDVPYKILEPQYTFANGKESEDATSQNKIIHGDNLEALKSLLPEYEGRIKCIYIDPPYNTGNEGWVYNDNVNDPKLKKWLGQVVGKESEDLSRHDKWLCMMYPRLKLLHKLLADDGAIFISIDDNEQGFLRIICDEIFGGSNFLANVIWEKVYSPRMDSKGFSASHDFIISYQKSPLFKVRKLKIEQSDKQFKNYDEEKKKYYRSRSLKKEGSNSLRTDRPNLYYSLKDPDGNDIFPLKPNGVESCWRWSMETYNKNVELGNVEWIKKNGKWQVYVKQWKEKDPKRPPNTLWISKEVGHNHSAKDEIKGFQLKSTFDTPKPSTLIERIISISANKNDIILDSFAGSGTTAHAVLNLNKEDGGNRKFILIEMEDYANTITAERVKRVIKGYGEGSKTIEGTGGDFTYYELGKPLFLDNGFLNEEVELDKILEYVWYSETRASFKKPKEEYLLGSKNDTAYYFQYQKDSLTTLDETFLRSIKTKASQYIIYADNCLLDQSIMDKYNIVFKKIPRDISRF